MTAQRDWSERLLTHYVGGSWRVPLSVEMRDVPALAARIVWSGAADYRRAGAHAKAVLPLWGALGLAQRSAALELCAPPQADPMLPKQASVRLLCARGCEPEALASRLRAVLALGHAVVLFSDPDSPIPAIEAVEACHRLALPAGLLAMLHGTPEQARAYFS